MIEIETFQNIGAVCGVFSVVWIAAYTIMHFLGR